MYMFYLSQYLNLILICDTNIKKIRVKRKGK